MVHFKKTDSVYGTSWPPDATMQDNQFVTWLLHPVSFMAKEDCCCLCYFHHTTQQRLDTVTHSSYGKLPMLLTPKVGIWSQLIHNYLSTFTCNMWERRYKSQLISLSTSPTSQLTSVYCFKYLQYLFTNNSPHYREYLDLESAVKYLLATIIFFSNLIIDISHMVGKKRTRTKVLL